MKDFYNLFKAYIQEIYAGEIEIIKAIPSLIETVKEPKLKTAFKDHLEETKKRAICLEEVASELNIKFNDKKSPVMHILLLEICKWEKSICSQEIKDAAIIAAAGCMEHYKLSVYRTLRSYALMLKLDRIENLLDQSLSEVANRDKTFSKIAEGTIFTKGINKKACHRNCA